MGIEMISKKKNTYIQQRYRMGIIAVVIMAVMLLVVFIGIWLHDTPTRSLTE